MTDQLIMYDQAVLTWLSDNFPPLLEGRTTQLLIATPRKAFAEVTTGRLVDERTMTLPRISIQRLDPVNAPERYNSNRIRRLGWCEPPVQRSLLSGKFPAPVNIPYQIDLWTRFTKEMNLWERYVYETFSSSYLYLQIRPNDIWGNKKYITFWEGSMINNSDLEPDEGERQIRKTFNLRSEGWIFDDDFLHRQVVKRIEAIFIDYDDQVTEYDRSFLPPLESIGTGDGNQTTFSKTLDRPPILPHTPVIQTVIGAQTEIVHDDGSGNWSGTNVTVSGSITYSTGAMTITFGTAPDAGEPITITYFTDLS